jgi:hypothetical protein
MTSQVFQCAGCGAALPAPDAVCSRCERELSMPQTDSHSGKYRCPNCSCRFDKPAEVWSPPDAPWYRPQTLKPQCPHCRNPLRDEKAVHLSPVEVGVFALLVIASDLSPWRPGAQFVLLLVFCGLFLWRWRSAQAAVSNEEERYAVEKKS